MPEQKREKGFSLIEVISVLAIIAIVSVLVVTRMTSTAEVDNKAKAEALKGHIRYVQMRAMNTDSSTSGCSASYGISMSANSYFMFKNCNKADTAILPGADAAGVALTDVTLSPSSDVTFDKWGRPCSDLNGTTPNNADITITLGTETIKITKNTGFVP